MPFEMTVQPKPGYLHIRITGDNTPQTVMEYLGAVRRVCEERQCRDVLVEENLAGPGLDTFEVFSIIDKRSSGVSQSVGRIAYVDVNPEHDRQMMQFAETVAVNRGVGMRVFASVSAAEKWLSGAPDGLPSQAPARTGS